MGMTNRETLRTVIDDMKSNGWGSQDQLNTVLLTSIASSLAIIADVLTDKTDKTDTLTILEELNTEIDETFKKEEPIDRRWAYGLRYSKNFIQQKINELREGEV